MTPRLFAWQAWHLATSTFVWHAPSFRVAGVAHADIHLRFAWQAWHLGDIHLRFAWQAWHMPTSTFVLRGRRGDIHLRFAWQAWHMPTFTFVSRGRCGTCAHPPSFSVAGVALGDIHLRGRRGTWSHRPTLCMSYFCACCSHVWPCLTCTQCLAVLATSSLGYLCMVWSLWPNVGRDPVHI